MKPIRILYDEWGFQETHGGVSRLFSEVMRNLPDGFEWVLPQPYTVNEYLKCPPFNVPVAKLSYRDFVGSYLKGHAFKGANRLYRLLAQLMPQKFPAYEVINRRARMKALALGDFDVYHPTAAHWCSFDWKIVLGKKPIVVTVCDLIPELVGKDPVIAHYRRPLLEAATHIIAISECTKRDIVRLYGIPEEKISVVYLGNSIKEPPCTSSTGRKPYILFVGKRNGYKNFQWFVRAVAPFLRGDSGYPKLILRCTGAPFNEAERKEFRALGVEGSVVQKFVTDTEMRDLFVHATCFVYPSLYEGFGIPILDAFAMGCPVLLANSSCFPEVADDAALYFDSNSIDDFRRKLLALARSDADATLLRHRLIQQGKNRVQLFSWKNCSVKYAEIYESVSRSWK